MTAVPAPSPAPSSLGELVRSMPSWLRHHLPATIVSVVIGGLISYVSNVWLMFVRYGGWQKVPQGSPATGGGNLFSGTLFWSLATGIVIAAVSYWRTVGTARFVSEVRALPSTLAGLVRSDGQGARIHLLWGAAVSLLAAQIISPSVGALMAVGLVALTPGPLGNMLTSAISRLVSTVMRRAAPDRQLRPMGTLSVAVGVIGSSAALVIGYFVSNHGLKWLLAAAAAGGAIALGQAARGKPPGPGSAATVILLFAAAGLAVDLLHPLMASATDGGEAECGIKFYQVSAWLSQCAGSHAVLSHAVSGGVAGGVGGAVGLFVGSAAGAAPTTTSPGSGPGTAPGSSTGPSGPARGPLMGPDGKPLTVNDGSWPDVPVGSVWYQGQWMDPNLAAQYISAAQHPLVDAYGNTVTVQDGRYPGVAPGQVFYNGQWVDRSVAEAAIAADRQALAQEQAQDDTRWAQMQAQHDQAFQNRVNQLNAEGDQYQAQVKAEERAGQTLSEIRDLATKHGFQDILDRANDPNALMGADGNLDPNYVSRLQAALHNALNLDRQVPPVDPNNPPPSWWQDGLEGTAETALSVARSLPVRLVVGVATGGSSEVAYQSLDAAEAMQNAVNAAYDKGDKAGQSFGFTDGLREGASVLAQENLPINNLENLYNLAQGKDVGVGDILKGLAADLMMSHGLSETAGNVSESFNALQHVQSPGELASALHTGENLYQRVVGEATAAGELGPLSGDGAGQAPPNALTAPEGTKLTPDGAAQMGIDMGAIKQANLVADQNLAAIELRETTPYVIDKPYSEGYSPKPFEIKAKTTNLATEFVGGPGADHLGEVAYFPPTEPATGDALLEQIRQSHPDFTEPQVQALANQVPDEFAKRQRDFANLADDMTKLQSGTGNIQVEVRDGVVYPVPKLPDGTIVEGPVRPYVGDHDIYRVQLAQTTGYTMPDGTFKSFAELQAENPNVVVNGQSVPLQPGMQVQSLIPGMEGAVPEMGYVNSTDVNPGITVNAGDGTSVQISPPGGLTKQGIMAQMAEPPFEAQHGAQLDFATDDPAHFQQDVERGGPVNIGTRDKYLPGNPDGNNLIRVEPGYQQPTLVRDQEWATQRPAAVQQAFDAVSQGPSGPPTKGGQVLTPEQWRPDPTLPRPSSAS